MSEEHIKRPSTGMLFLIDVGENSPQKVTLVRLVMKGVRISHENLWLSLGTLPEEKRMERESFDKFLDELVQEEWLWRAEIDGQVVYSPRLKTNEGKPK